MNKKQRLRKICDKEWANRCFKPLCEVCGCPTHQIHHFFPKGQFGHLRFIIENGVSLCKSCHFEHHHKGDPRIHQAIISKRGKEWFEKLRDMSRLNPASYQTISYYKISLERLKKYEQNNKI